MLTGPSCRTELITWHNESNSFVDMKLPRPGGTAERRARPRPRHDNQKKALAALHGVQQTACTPRARASTSTAHTSTGSSIPHQGSGFASCAWRGSAGCVPKTLDGLDVVSRTGHGGSPLPASIQDHVGWTPAKKEDLPRLIRERLVSTSSVGMTTVATLSSPPRSLPILVLPREVCARSSMRAPACRPAARAAWWWRTPRWLPRLHRRMGTGSVIQLVHPRPAAEHGRSSPPASSTPSAPA